jgi:hypothetical protein
MSASDSLATSAAPGLSQLSERLLPSGVRFKSECTTTAPRTAGSGSWPSAALDWHSGRGYLDSGAALRGIRPTSDATTVLDSLPPQVQRLWLCGPLPDAVRSGTIASGSGAARVTRANRDTLAQLLAWGLDLAAESSWIENPATPHYHDPDEGAGSVVLHCVHRDTGRTVEVRSLAGWVGDELALTSTPEDACALFRWLAEALDTAFVRHAKVPRRPPALYGTAAWTGRALLIATSGRMQATRIHRSPRTSSSSFARRVPRRG